MKRVLAAACLSLFGLAAAFPQDRETLQQLLEKALVIQIQVKVTDKNSRVLSFQAAKVAMSGEPFPVTLDGRSIRGTILFTPYEEPDGRVLLVAQVQLWIQESSTVDWKYVSSLKSIPAAMDETVRFFPLGMEAGAAGVPGRGSIELDLKVDRYKSYIEKMRTPAPKPGPLPAPDGGSIP